MIQVSREEFEEFVNHAVSSLPKAHLDSLKNVAIIVEDEPNQEQRIKLKLRQDQSLFGLYEGLPLSQRQGTVKMIPDKITIFQLPIEYFCNNLAELKNQIGKTIWHEVAHYYGLNHDDIGKLENKSKLS